MGDFEQSLRDQFGSERNQRIAALEAELAAERERAEELFQVANQTFAALVKLERGVVIGLWATNNPQSVVCHVDAVAQQLADERTALREAEAREDACRTAFYQEVNHRVQCQEATRAAEAQELALREALTELVSCKDLKKRMGQLNEMRLSEYEQLKAEYNRRKPLAWDKARIALSSPSPAAERVKEIETRESALRSELTNARDLLEECRPYIEYHTKFANPAQFGERSVHQIKHGVDAALSQPSPAAERIKALEEEHKLALTLCQRIDDTVGDVKDFAECVDRQHAAYEAWRTVVEKVGEE